MGAHGLAVAAAFAVALAVLVSVSSTPTAEAAIQERDGNTFTARTDGGAVNNGDTVYIQNAATGFVLYEITAIGNASASFTHSSAQSDGQILYCSPATGTNPTCDADTGDAGSTVAVKIDADSGVGGIIVKQTVLATGTTTADELTVSVAPVPTKLTAEPDAKAINSNGEGAAGTTFVDIRLTDASGKGIADAELTVVSTRATLATAATQTRTVGDDTVALGSYTGATLAGNVTTSPDPTPGNTSDGAGYARVQVTGAGSPGVATITVTFNELTASANIVLYGAVTKIAAEAEQSAIEQGGKTLIVVTATDAGGNPVAGHTLSVKSGASGIVGPTKDAREVTFNNQVNKDAAPVGTLGKGDIPACGTVEAVADVPDTDENEAVAASTGTNDEGKCVIQIDAGSGSGTADDAARGTHTVTIAGPKADGSADVKVEIQVGGKPDSITSDAPRLLSPSEELTVNLTVRDDEGVRVGRTTIEVLETVKYGALLEEPTMTSDGRAKFTYLAPSTPGVVEFLVRTKAPNGAITAKLPIIIRIAETMEDDPVDTGPTAPSAPDFVRISRTASGMLRVTTTPGPGEGMTVQTEVSDDDGASWTDVPSGAPAAGEYIGRARFAMGDLVSSWAYSPNSVVVVEDEPDMPDVPDEPAMPDTPTLSVTGNLGVFSGGSLADLAAAAGDACAGGAVVWAQDSGGAWQVWSSSAPDIANIGFTSAFADGFSGVTPLWISACEADAMENEG